MSLIESPPTTAADSLEDNYDPRMRQTEGYYIHPAWSDADVKQFRKNVRRQNICIRQGLRFYSESRWYRWKGGKRGGRGKKELARDVPHDTWFPDRSEALSALVAPPAVRLDQHGKGASASS